MGHVYRGEARIAAPPAAVWEVLVDLDAYPRWNPFTVGVRSSLEVGAEVALTVRMGPSKVVHQTERVRRNERARALDWGMTIAGGALVRGERTQRLAPDGDGTLYVTEDAITGALAWLVDRLYGAALTEGFQAMADALKAEVERRS